MGVWGLLGAILSFAVGMAQLLASDWTGAVWTVLGVGLLYSRRRWH